MTNRTFQVNGRIINRETRQGVPRFRVEVWDKDFIFNDLVGSAITDEDGGFCISFAEDYYKECFLDRQPDLFFKVYQDSRFIHSTENSVCWNVNAGETNIVIEVDAGVSENPPTETTGTTETTEPEEPNWVVRGRVVNHELRGETGLCVVAVDKSIDSEVRLGKGTTGERGAYEIHYSVAHLDKEKPDVKAQVTGESDEILAVSAIRYNAGPVENGLDIVIPEEKLSLPAEYCRLINELGAQLGNLDETQLKQRLATLKEDDQQQDITYLANKTGWDARMVAMTALASQFSERSGIEPEFYYALFRAGVPANQAVLSQLAPETVQQAWEHAVEQKILPAEMKAKIAESLERFKKHGVDQLLEVPAQIGISSFKELIANTLGDTARQQRFSQLYYDNKDDLVSFWEAVRVEFPEEANRLQLVGKLSFLTTNNAPLIRQLHTQIGTLETPLDLVRHGLYQRDAWGELLAGDVPIPDEISGESLEEKKANYAGLMADQLRLSYPTAVVADMVRTDAIPLRAEQSIKTAVTQFLDVHQGKFELGIHPVEQYLRTHDISLDDHTLSGLKSLQRVYQISPSEEVMGTLLRHGLDSAYAVSRYDEQSFVSAFKDELGDEATARWTYHKAHMVHHTIFSLSTHYLLEKSAPLIYAITQSTANGSNLSETWQTEIAVTSETAAVGGSGAVEVVMTAEESGVLPSATLERVLGEMDYCACEHCRSWLSPAAYLVDLLHFIDLRRFNSDGEELPSTFERDNPLDVLLGRRPDIQHLQLTCENTNTVLPYIDLVNEMLEHHVVNSSLDAFEGHNIKEGITTEELLANPQYVNDVAYEELRNQIFPLPLPFHQPLEALRRYFEYSELPLHEVMERLRKNDNLENSDVDDAGESTYGWRDILIERLKISRSEYAILTNSKIPLQRLFGEDRDEVTVDQLINHWRQTDPPDPRWFGISNAKFFSRKLNISYEELIKITRTRFINPHSHLIPKLEKLGVNIDTILKYLNDWPTDEADFRTKVQLNELDITQYGGRSGQSEDEKFAQLVKWLQNNEDQIKKLIVLSDPNGSNDVCSFDTVELCYVDNVKLQPFEFRKMLHFIRLWRKLGWSIEQTDKMIAALYPVDQYSTLNDDEETAKKKMDDGFKTLILRLGHLQVIMDKLNLSPERDLTALLACWSPIDTQGQYSLYRQMFLNPTILSLDDVFGEDGYGHYLLEPWFSIDLRFQADLENGALSSNFRQTLESHSIIFEPGDSIQIETTKAAIEWRIINQDQDWTYTINRDEINNTLHVSPNVGGHSDTLRAAFNLTQEEFEQILQELSFGKHTVLNLVNVSAIFRHGYLARKLRLSVQDFLALKNMSGLDPFLPLDMMEPSDKTQVFGAVRPPAIRFIELVHSLKDSPFKVSQLQYFLQHKDLSGKASPLKEEILALARTLRNDLLRIDQENKVQEDPDGEIARAKMTLVYGNETTDIFFGLLNNTTTFSVDYSHGQSELKSEILAITDRISYDDYQKQLFFRGVMTALEKVKLETNTTDKFKDAIQQLYGEGQGFFDQYPELRFLHDAYQFFVQLKTVESYKFAPESEEPEEVVEEINNFKKLVNEISSGRLIYSDADEQEQLLFKGVMEDVVAENLKDKVNDEEFTKVIDTLHKENQEAIKDFFDGNKVGDGQREMYLKANDSEEQQRTVLLESFTPTFRRRLKRQQVRQTISAQADADLALITALLEKTSLLHAVGRLDNPAIDDFLKLETQGLSADIFFSDDMTGDPDQADILVSTIDYREGGATLPSNGNNAVSGVWRGFLEAPVNAFYNFYINANEGAEVNLILDGKDLTLVQSGTDGAWKNDSRIELDAGRLYELVFTTKKIKDNLFFEWEREGMGRVPIPASQFYPETLMERFKSSYLRLLKVLAVADSLALSDTEYAHFAVHTDYSLNGSANIFFADDITGNVDQANIPVNTIDYQEGKATTLPSNGNNPVSGVWSGFLEAPDDGFYNFYIAADSGAEVSLTLSGEAVTLRLNSDVWQNQDPINLEAGRLYELVFIAKKVKNLLVLRWEHSSESLSGRTVLPISVAGWLNALPTELLSAGVTTQLLLRNILALLQYRTLKQAFKISDDGLLKLLQDPLATDEDGESLLNRITGWQKTDNNFLLDHFDRTIGEGDLIHLENFVRLQDAFAVVDKLGITAVDLVKNTTNEPKADTVRNLQAAMRARYEQNVWLKVIQPINDELRRLQRNALVAYVLHGLGQNEATKHINTPNKLFEYFLIDVEMDPCMKTSRIKQALSSVQLFIQRCLLNLEPQVAPSSIKANQWKWMNRYRVWEANRKVFLWPENWLEPELRDNKSPFFKDLESELLQSDITDESAVTALVHYLEKLDEVAKLEICGMYYEENVLEGKKDKENDVTHVIARTAGARRIYYYRRQEGRVWTPWEKIDLNIEDNPVLPVVWKGRLLLFWVSVGQEAAEPVTNPPHDEKPLANTLPSEVREAAGEARTRVTVTLYWSEYYHGKWQPVRTSDLNKPLVIGYFKPNNSDREEGFDREKLELRSFIKNQKLDILVTYHGNLGSLFTIHNTNSVPIIGPSYGMPINSVPSNGSSFGNVRLLLGIWNVTWPSHLRDFSENGSELFFFKKEYLNGNFTNTPPKYIILRNVESYQTIQPQHEVSDIFQAPFFFQDHSHVFFVESKATEIPLVLWPGTYLWLPFFLPWAYQQLIQPSTMFSALKPGIENPGDVDPNPLRSNSNMQWILDTEGVLRFGNYNIGQRGSVLYRGI